MKLCALFELFLEKPIAILQIAFSETRIEHCIQPEMDLRQDLCRAETCWIEPNGIAESHSQR